MTRDEKDRLTDTELIVAIRQGETEKFEELFNRYQFLVLKVSRSYVIRDYDLDDIMQEARILFFKVIHEYRLENGMNFGNFYKMKMKQFFVTIIRRQNAIKRQGAKYCDSLDAIREKSSDESYRYAPQNEGTPEAMLMVQEEMLDYYQLLSTFEKQVLSAYTKGLTIEAIARLYGKTAESVKNALSRCRTKYT